MLVVILLVFHKSEAFATLNHLLHETSGTYRIRSGYSPSVPEHVDSLAPCRITSAN